jgi:hypothetical protein
MLPGSAGVRYMPVAWLLLVCEMRLMMSFIAVKMTTVFRIQLEDVRSMFI